MKKALLIGAVVLAGVLGIAGYWLFASLDSIVKRAIERYGPEITQVSVDVGRVEISPRDGRGRIDGLRLGNPQGYRGREAFSADAIELALDPATLTRDTLVIRHIEVRSPRVFYEAGRGGESNFDVIQRSVRQFRERHPRQDQSSGRLLIVERLSIRDIKVSYAPFLLEGKGFEVALPDIELRDIGKEQGGVTAGELVRVVTEALMSGVTRAITHTLKGAADATRSVTDAVKGLFK